MTEVTDTTSSPTAIGAMIDELMELRHRKRELNDQLKELDEEYKALESRIMETMDREGTRLTASSRTRVSISESTVPTVTDWEAFEQYVKENDAMYLFERRVASKPWRELQESGERVPGTEPFTRRSLSLRQT